MRECANLTFPENFSDLLRAQNKCWLSLELIFSAQLNPIRQNFGRYCKALASFYTRKRQMNLEVSRRHFLKAAGTGVAGTALGAFGFSAAEAMVAAHVRPFKLANTTETRNTCPYCSVACGIIMYSRGDIKKGEKSKITHIEGDYDHPTNRGTLCPKGAGLLDMVNAPTRTSYPQIREPGSAVWKRLSWDEALDRIARLLKDDRDKNFIAANKDGVTVNRWITTGFLAASATTNETALATWKVVRSTGMVVFDNQARV
jgi:formate dehydrogenase major subunit